jgi:hypothetical protein
MLLKTEYNIQNSGEETYYPLLPSLVLCYVLTLYKSFDSSEVII